jgi:hypothetical protein
VHEHHANTIRSRERRLAVRRALLGVVEAADPHVVVRCRKLHAFIDQDSDAGVGEPANDVNIVGDEVVVAKDGELAERRLDRGEQRHETIDMASVEGHEVAAKQEQIGLGPGERVARVGDQSGIRRRSGVQIGREPDADRRSRAPRPQDGKCVPRDAERAVKPEQARESRRPRPAIDDVVPDLRDTSPRRQVPRAAEPAGARNRRVRLCACELVSCQELLQRLEGPRGSESAVRNRQFGALGALLTTVGVAVGVAAGAAATRLFASMLYGVSSLDRAVYLETGSALAVVGLLAMYVPARRATRVDPVVALRAE